jgi:putative DNA modification/repair radical SAM protein
VAVLDLKRKLAILSDAAKYDASCASSGRRSGTPATVGAWAPTEGMGICHAYAPDGRCISLLKLLLTNFCVYDCAYCVNRVSSNTPRARFSVQEVVDLTLSFYRRNYIEGLFLSSGIIRDEDYTMGAMVEVARTLREVHDFPRLHPPEGDRRRLAGAGGGGGRYADRLSSTSSCPGRQPGDPGPEKDPLEIKRAMGAVRASIDEARDARAVKAKPPRFAPAGQSTQMIVGADAATDADILTRSETLYGSYGLRRVYYSAFSPIPDSAAKLPSAAPPLLREHRLYQADWLMRFYGFSRGEIVAGGEDGMLDTAVDPKLAWALKHRGAFP